MAAEFPADLHFDVKNELFRILPLLQEAGWTVEPIQREANLGMERRVSFCAKSLTGKRVHSTCPENRLASRLTALLASTNF